MSRFIGPFAYDDQAKAALLQAAVERTRAEPGVELHVAVISNALDALLGDVVGKPAHETYLLALPEQSDFLRVESSIRRAVKKATREGVEVRQAETEGELRTWYVLYVQTMRRVGALPRPYHLFELAWRRLHSKGQLRLLLAEHVEAGRRRLLGGIVLLLYGHIVSFDSAGWREEDQALRPNDVLHWQAIHDACADGFRWYDFGDVGLGNQGLARYKRKWGAEAQLVYDYSYPLTHNHNAMNGTPKQSRTAVKQLVRATYQRLPPRALGLLTEWYYGLHLY